MDTRQKLEAIAENLWWSWHPDALDLFRRLNPESFDNTGDNPQSALRQADFEVLDDPAFEEDVDEVYSDFAAYMAHGPGEDAGHRTAYFCMEFGLHQSLPLYSGGLGILAGDHLKAASDARVPLTGIGLFLRDGYFKQYFNDKLLQQTEYPSIDVTRHPMEPVVDENGETLVITVHCGTEPVHLRAFRLRVGHVDLFLLDSDFNSNRHEDRFLTSRLYQGRTKIRLKQEIVLGIGGVRLLRAINRPIDVFHMNEGHCALLTLELLREQGVVGKEEQVRSGCVFTTHTPVLAGHDRFEPELLLEQLEQFQLELGMSDQELLSFGRTDPDNDDEPFTMTVLALKMARTANGVSELNGHVTRRQWHPLYADRPVEEVPIGHITNGVHLPTWTSHASRLFLKKHIGPLDRIMTSPEMWAGIHDVFDADLWAYRSRLRRRFVEYVEARCRRQSFDQKVNLSPDALTIGFARRFASYKRATLIFSDLERARRLFSNPDRPLQIVFAGKSHPDNDEGRFAIQELLKTARQEGFAGRVVFLENYHMGVARQLISGCDIWLNTPRRPHEACGTSGQKVNVHGGLNLSILDGWWSEGYDGSNGWAIGDRTEDEHMDIHAQDARDADLLYSILENDVVPAFYNRNEAGIPDEWLKRIRSAMSELTYRFSAHRMITDYAEQIYNVQRYAAVPEDM